MKRLAVIPIMILYIMAVSGIMVHAHYCGQVLESWNMYVKADGCEDGGCGDEEEAPDSCCEDKVISYKVTNDQHHADAQRLKLSVPVLDAIVDHGYNCDGSDCLHCARGKQDYLANAPPGLWQSIPLYKLHSSLTYYG